MKWILYLPGLVLLTLLLEPVAMGMTLFMDNAGFKDEAERTEIEQATKSMQSTNRNLGSVETLVAFFGEGRVYPDSSGTFVYQNTNLTVQAAHNVLGVAYPADFLKEVAGKGTDLAAYWALHNLRHPIQTNQSKATIRDMVLEAEKTRSPRTRAVALKLVGDLELVDDVPAFLRNRLADGEEAVVAVAVSSLMQVNSRHRAGSRPDVETKNFVWQKLPEAKTDELAVACLHYLWLVEDSKPSDSQAALLGQISRSSSPRVRAAAPRAISPHVSPLNPALLAILFRLAEDKDEMVRYEALGALRDANTPEVSALLRQHFDRKESSSVRSAALRTLGSFGAANTDVILAAARDTDQNIRMDSTMFLRQFGGPEAIAALEILVNDPEKSVRTQAASQLDWARKEGKISQKP